MNIFNENKQQQLNAHRWVFHGVILMEYEVRRQEIEVGLSFDAQQIPSYMQMQACWPREVRKR